MIDSFTEMKIVPNVRDIKDEKQIWLLQGPKDPVLPSLVYISLAVSEI